MSAAAMAVWLLTHRSPFWAGPPLRPSQVTVIGPSNPPASRSAGRGALGLSDLRRLGPGKAVGQISEAIPASAQVLLHFDIDVLRKEEMPAAYFPHDDGLTLSEGMELLGALLRDPRIRIIEVAEYATLRDLDHSYVSKLVDLLAKGLRS
jgi:arginase